jgi:hypothetical protein
MQDLHKDEICATIRLALDVMESVDKVELAVPSAKLRVCCYYNSPQILRIELRRTDKNYVFDDIE